jgi:hypothetical protein
VPEVSLDYCFLKDDMDKASTTVLVMRAHKTRVTFANVVLAKGRDQEASVDLVASNLKKLGHKKIILKADQEPAIVDLVNGVIDKRAEETLPEFSPVGDHRANGVAERAVQEVEDQVRTMKGALQRRLGVAIETSHPVMTWMIEHAAGLISRYLVGHDGRTAYQRHTGKKCREDIREFGESVLYKKRFARKPSLQERWAIGTWIGKRWSTSEHVIVAEDGNVVHAGVVHPRPFADRWQPQAVEKITALPWCMTPNARIAQTMPEQGMRQQEEPGRLAGEEAPPRRFQIMRADLERWGYTDGCPKCRATRAKLAGRGREHTTACRNRITAQARLHNDPRMARRDELENKWVAERGPEAEPAIGDNLAEPIVEEESAGVEAPAAEPMADWGQHLSPEDMESPEPPVIEPPAERDEIMALLMTFGVSKGDAECKVSELYSPPRVTEGARKYSGLHIKPGTAFDLKIDDETGQAWDFRKLRNRQRARKMIEEEKPYVLVGSPPCVDFTTLNQGINHKKMPPEEVERRMREARLHLDFCAELYRLQLREGRVFLHEHPAGATSWCEASIKQVMADARVHWTVGHMCAQGMTSVDEEGIERPVRKATRWMSNGIMLLRALMGRCDGSHKHTVLLNGRPEAAAVYPPKLVRSILRGIKDQWEADFQMPPAGVLRDLCAITTKQIHEITQNAARRYECDRRPIEEQAPASTNGNWNDDWCVDDVSGEFLDPQLVKAAREEEMTFLKTKRVYDKVPIEEARRITGKAPIGTRWIDINKGDEANPDYRSRWVAQEINRGKVAEYFASTPPLEALRMLMSHMASNTGEKGAPIKMLFIDVRRAYFNAVANRPTYIKPPDMDAEEGMCGRLNKCLYGTRDAAVRWEATYQEVLKQMGFMKGAASPCCFYHPKRSLRMVVHGDDLTCTGIDEHLDWFEKEVKNHFEVKVRGRLGGGAENDKEMRILNRVVRWTPDGLTWEADQRHAEILIRELGMSEANPVVSPGIKNRNSEEEEEEEKGKLEEAEATRFRALAARANYLAADRPDMAYAAKEICRLMSAPTHGAWRALKRVARYLVGKPRMVYMYPWVDGATSACDICVDTDWAGCTRTRKSTSGGVVLWNGHVIKHWSTTQSVVALSSAEAELIGIVKGVSQGMGLKSIAEDLGMELELAVHTDSSAAMGIVQRSGIGRVRHLDVSLLWVQDHLHRKTFKLAKVAGTDNPADMLTKHVEGALIDKHSAALGAEFSEGRARSAPKLAGGA